jgi:NADH:ubiquinone reductase (H+-translocating)
VPPFIYETKGLLASLGHHRGVGRIGKLRVYGFIGWWLRRSYYLFQMPQISRRVRIVIDWTVQLFFHNDVVQLDLQREKDALRMTATAPPAVEKSSAAGALQPASTHAAP